MTTSSRIALCALALPLASLGGGCATLGNLHGASVKLEELTARNQAVESAAAGPLAACATKGKPEDSGAFGVSAAADGALTIDAVQWSGSDEGKQCILAETAKAKLPPWGGGVTSAIWAIGTKEHPAPPPIANEPPGVKERLNTLVPEMMGAPDMGPLATCIQQNLSNDAYARVTFKVVIFPDGKVASVTPVALDGEGRDAGFQDCVRKLMTPWTFTPFPGPGYYATTIPVQKGLNDSNTSAK